MYWYIINIIYHFVPKSIYVSLFFLILNTVNPEIFAGILFSRIELRDILAALKIRDYSTAALIRNAKKSTLSASVHVIFS